MEDEITDITDQLEDLENQGMPTYLFYTVNLCIFSYFYMSLLRT